MDISLLAYFLFLQDQTDRGGKENYSPLEKIEKKATGCRNIVFPANFLFLQDQTDRGGKGNYPPLEKVENKALGCRDISLPANFLFLQDQTDREGQREVSFLIKRQRIRLSVQEYFITILFPLPPGLVKENYPPLEQVENKALGCRNISLPANFLFLQDQTDREGQREVSFLRKDREQGFMVHEYFLTS